MADKEYSSIEEIDADLDKEFAQEIKEPETDENDDIEFEEGFGDDDEYDIESDQTDLEEDEDKDEDKEDDEPKKKPSRGDKEAYAFAKIREEKAAAERKAQQEEAFMRKLAKASGYGDDINQYKKDLEHKLIEQEARQQGMQPEAYKELAEAKAKLESYEKEKRESDRMAKSQNFLKTVNKVLKSYDLDTQETGKELFDILEKAGYTIDTLLEVPEPEFLIRGALYDKLSKTAIKDRKISEGLDTRKIKSSPSQVKTVDELIEEEMAEYAKSRGLKYSK